MSPDVLKRKLAKMAGYLEELRPHAEDDLAGHMRERFKIERLLELLFEAASDIVLHLLKRDGGIVDSYRSGFRRAAEEGILPVEMADELALASGMRNVLVHDYDEIDHRIVHRAVPAAIGLYERFVALFNRD